MLTFKFLFIEIYLILIIPKVQMTVFTVIIQKKMHCQLYFVTFDKIINSIKDRFHLTDDQIYVHLREILIKPFKEQDWEDDLQIVLQNYGANEFDVLSLKTQLLLLPEIPEFYDLDSRMQLSVKIDLFQKLDTIKRILVAKVIQLVKLILIMLATNAVSERSFSSFKRIKTYFSQQ